MQIVTLRAVATEQMQAGPSLGKRNRIELPTTGVTPTADKLNYLLEPVRIASRKRTRLLALHRAGNSPIAKQPIYVQLETSFEADAFTGSGHDTLQG
jgi:hypothetical protein